MLRIKCLGQLSVLRDDGQPLAGAASQPRRLAILALLARSGDRGITREKVIRYLWPDSDEERARRLLSQAVYMLRRDLGSDDAIVGVHDLRLGSDILTSDVAEFQEALESRSYERAATLYGGPFLDGFHLPGAGEFERWVEEERRALEHDGDTAFEKCALAAETRGDHGTAVIWWRRMAAKEFGTVGTVTSSTTQGTSSSAPRRQRWAGLLIAVVVVAILLVSAGFWVARGRGAASAAVVVPSRVVVAPLENRTGNPALDAVGSMVAEWITQGLLRTGLVQVVDARTMLETARDAGPSRGDDYQRTLAERTSAGTVVSGSYFIEGDQLRFLMRITGAPSGEVRYTVDVVNAPIARPTAALEPLCQRVTGALAVLLDPRLDNWTARTSQPPTYEAYGEFLLGMETFGPDYENSVRHFTRAAQLDTTYWQAKLWDAMANANLHRYAPADSLFQLLDRNRANLASYDEANLDYFYAGFVRGDWEMSYRGARRMVELAPGAAHAFYAAGLTSEITNRPREAIDVLRRVNTSEGWGKAWAPRVYNLISRSYHQLGDYQHDLEWAKQLRASEPNVGWTRLEEVKATAALGRGTEAFDLALDGASFPSTTETWEDYTPGDFLWQSGRELRTHGYPALAREAFLRAERWYASRPPDEKATRDHRRSLARVLDDLDRWAEARAIYATLFAEDSSTVEHLGALGVLSARLGRTAEADSIATRLVADARPYTFGGPRLWAARIAAVKGDREGAVALIHQALREGYARLHSLHAEHDFESLRDFPAFREILEPRVSASQ